MVTRRGVGGWSKDFSGVPHRVGRAQRTSEDQDSWAAAEVASEPFKAWSHPQSDRGQRPLTSCNFCLWCRQIRRIRLSTRTLDVASGFGTIGCRMSGGEKVDVLHVVALRSTGRTPEAVADDCSAILNEQASRGWALQQIQPIIYNSSTTGYLLLIFKNSTVPA